MKETIKKLISDNNEVSHKRVLAIASFVVLVGMVALSAFGHTVDDKLIYVFASMSGGESVLTLIEKFTGK